PLRVPALQVAQAPLPSGPGRSQLLQGPGGASSRLAVQDHLSAGPGGQGGDSPVPDLTKRDVDGAGDHSRTGLPVLPQVDDRELGPSAQQAPQARGVESLLGAGGAAAAGGVGRARDLHPGGGGAGGVALQAQGPGGAGDLVPQQQAPDQGLAGAG